MQLRSVLIPLVLAGAASAQLSLVIPPATGALQYLWVPGPTTNTVGFFFDMTVNTTVTFQGVSFPSYTPVGRAMTLTMHTTNTGITTYVGNELLQANWTLRGTAAATIPLGPTTPSVCFPQGITLQPGTYGVVLGATNCNNLFSNNGPQTISNTELTVVAGATTAQLWGTAPSAYGTQAFHFNGTLYYAPGAVAHSCATRTEYGKGCNLLSGSFYQKFTSNAAMATALNTRRLSLLFTGVNYTLTQGLPTVGYIAPTASAISLPANNNGEATVTLPGPLNYPGGSTTQLVIATDGHIAPATNLPFPGQNYNFMPFEHGFLNAINPIWAVCWHNFNTTELGSGLIKYETVGNLFIVTWDNVESLPGTATAATPNPCTFQAQFDLTTGDVHYVYQTMTTGGGSQSYDETIVGYSPGGPSPDNGPINLVTLTAVVLPPVEVMPLKLTASAAPVLGTTIDLVTSSESNPNVGVNFLSLAAIPPPGIDLGIIGAPGCFAHIDLSTAVGNAISNLGAPLPSMIVQLPIPVTASLSGILITSQSAWLDAGANPFGVITSNGVSLTLGLFAL
ncbi:MAG: hypothetical protein WAT39_20445 [Planctomycetota bacterium]